VILMTAGMAIGSASGAFHEVSAKGSSHCCASYTSNPAPLRPTPVPTLPSTSRVVVVMSCAGAAATRLPKGVLVRCAGLQHPRPRLLARDLCRATVKCGHLIQVPSDCP
jgi:hypothetical protein